MTSTPCIQVPSPDTVKARLFPAGKLATPLLDPKWTATVLLTPQGGTARPGGIADELVVARITYDGSMLGHTLMRFQMYGMQSLSYCDLLLSTIGGTTTWWYLQSTPAALDGIPASAIGPRTTDVAVPPPDLLQLRKFEHAGTWEVGPANCDGFVAPNAPIVAGNPPPGGMWIWTNANSRSLSRIMNTAGGNPYLIPVLGAYYLGEFVHYQAASASDLQAIFAIAPQAANPPLSPLRTLADVQAAVDGAPAALVRTCTQADIGRVAPGVRFDLAAIAVPSWTNKVTSECYMIGQDLYPYHCQLYYDWDRGNQVTVFVQQDDAGNYNQRFDELLPKGAVGPAIIYSWDGAKWVPSCSAPDAGFVPMPVPDFVRVGGGQCRGAFLNNAYYGNASIWSVTMGGAHGSADFWYRFDDQGRGVIFSLSPAGSLTMIDYQTFQQNSLIQACIFSDPTADIVACGAQQMSLRTRTNFAPLMSPSPPTKKKKGR